MSKAVMISGLSAALVFLAGCGVQPPATQPAFATQDRQFNAVWDAGDQVLREFNFAIDRADRRAGVITTFPLVGRHWFEFWRQDAATPFDVLEGTLHAISRRAVVTIARAGPASGPEAGEKRYVARVEVRTTRSDLLSYHVTSTADAYEMFVGRGEVGRAPAPEDLSSGRGGSRQEDLGRDGKLEQVLQRRIEALAAKNLTMYSP